MPVAHAGSYCRVSVCPECVQCVCVQHGSGATCSSASQSSSALRGRCTGWARCFHFPHQRPETLLAPGDLCIHRADCPRRLFQKERPGQWTESNECLGPHDGEQSASVCVHGCWDGTLTVKIPVLGDELERVAAACDVSGLHVPGRLLLADGEDSSRPRARSWFGKETIQTTSFLLWMSAAKRRGLCP